MRRHHALADGRAVATPILRLALEGWGGKDPRSTGRIARSIFRARP